jgi:alcohol dehydrogenase (cytochrome c)
VVGKAAAVTKNLGYDRILKAREAEPHNWITYYGGYDGQRYSLLDQINASNVKSLTPAWVFQAGTVGMQSGAGTYSMEASPIVVDGVMYLTGSGRWTRQPVRSCGATSTRHRTTSHCAAAT